jgi:neurexin
MPGVDCYSNSLAYCDVSASAQLKTTLRDGLVLYIGGDRDFLAVELVDGHIRYVYDVGGGPRMVHVQSRYTVSDNRWHDVAVLRNELTKVGGLQW